MPRQLKTEDYVERAKQRRLVSDADKALKQLMRDAILNKPDGMWVLIKDVLFHPSKHCDENTGPGGCCEKSANFYEPLHKEWACWAQAESVEKRGILAPRGHFKSSVISFGKCVWSILKNPNVRILIVSQKLANAVGFCGQAKKAFQDNERMRWLFPEYCVDSGKQFGNQQEFTVPNRTDISLVAPTVYSVHLGAAMASQHYDIIIADDPISDDDVTTEEQAQKSYSNFGRMVPLLDPGGQILVVGCLTSDAVITMADGSPRKICDVMAGECVWSVDTNGTTSKRVVDAVIPQGSAPVYSVATETRELKATANHPFLKYHAGALKWERADALKPGDLVVTSKTLNTDSSYDWVTESFAWLAGFILGDGWVRTYTSGKHSNYQGYLAVAKSTYTDLNKRVIDTLSEWFPDVTFHDTPFGYVRGNDIKMAEALIELGLGGNAHTKTIPSWVFGLKPELKQQFLRGLCDADGFEQPRTKESFRLELCNSTMVEQAAFLADTCGVRHGRILSRTRRVKPPHSKDYITSNTASISLNFAWCGIPESGRGGTWGTKENSGASEFITKMPNDIRLERVSSITFAGDEDVFDLTINGTPSFFANGFAVHNTRYSYMDLFSTLVPVDMGGNAPTTPYTWIVRSVLENAEGKPDFDNGEPIFPTRFSREVVASILEACILNPTQGETYFWNQYMNQCRAPGMQPFLAEWFVEIEPERVPPLFGTMIVTDTALKDDARRPGGDFTVIGPGGWDVSGRLYLLPDGVRSNRMLSKEFLDIITAWMRKYNTPFVAKQKVSEDTLGTAIKDAATRALLPIIYKPLVVTGMGNKQVRIKDALQAPMHRREVIWVQRRLNDGTLAPHPLLEITKKELVNLGQFPTDDAGDWLANFFHPEVRVNRQNIVGQQRWHVPGAPVQISSDPASRWHREATPMTRASGLMAEWLRD